MGEFSLMHWLLVAGILLIFFGPSKLPSLGKSMGEAIRGFKKGLNEDEPAPARPESLSASNVQDAPAAKKTEREHS